MAILNALLILNINAPLPRRTPEKLRGFFGSLYRDNDLFHNHATDGKDIYRYPKIQYKVVNGSPAIQGLNGCAELVQNEFIRHEKIKLGDIEYPVLESKLEVKREDFNVTDELYEYRFESLWLALNEKNHDAYRRGELDLNRALANNLLSDMKGLGIWTDKRIMAKGCFTPREVTLDNTTMIGFLGDFVCNVKIPGYLGTGKRKSIGFGVIVRKA